MARQRVIRGPGPDVLSRRSTVKPLTVSAVGCGVAATLLDMIEAAGPRFPEDFAEIITCCRRRYRAVREQLHHGAAEIGADPEAFSATALRARVNDLVTRLALVALTLSKGSGYLRDHRAQRLCREAMFFLVWSLPAGTQLQTLRHLLAAWPAGLT